MMTRFARDFGKALVLILLGPLAGSFAHGAPPAIVTSGPPDPAAVERFGPAYRYPQAGWIVLHVEGDPYERGYQHGRLLAPEIADYVSALATKRSHAAPEAAWQQVRTLVGALFLRRYDPEYLEEIKGIADGAAAGGARFKGRALDLVDLVAVNSEIEVDFLDSALEATPTGLEGRTFREPQEGPKPAPHPEHCSAFAATGPATADGQIVFGHITMFSLFMVHHFNVWLDIKPSRGHRVLMQTYPGGIQSGMDYYMNDAGLLVAETTIDQTKFNPDGQALASRIRKVLQYADGIDDAVKILTTSNNGMYTNEWLFGDTRTGEVAMFELGTDKHRLWRSSRDEWLGGTRGFYWGCNNTKDLAVRLETVPSMEGKPANVVFHPTDRDRTWLRLFAEAKATIDAGFGFRSFMTPPLCAAHSCDAKFTTTAMARELKTWARFGPPQGPTWEPTARERESNPGIRPLVANDWTILSAEPPPSASAGAASAVDLASTKAKKATESEADPAGGDASGQGILPAAWHGTLLPASDADIWLAVAFADYESIVARERAIRAKAKDRALKPAEQDQLRLALFAPHSRYKTAVARRGSDVALAAIVPDLNSDEWYQIAAGKGVLLLAALRQTLGDEPFLKLMHDFGRAHAGQRVWTEEFRTHAEAVARRDLRGFFTPWLSEPRLPADPGGGYWSIDSFEAEPEKALIVFGTLKEADAQREAADHLQRGIAQRWSNVRVPIRSDHEVSEAELRSHHILLIGRPDTNAVAARLAGALPVRFGAGSFVLRNETYAHPATAVIAAGSNPLSARYEVVVFAGLSSEATRRLTQQTSDRRNPPAEIWLWSAGAKPRALVATPAGADTRRPGNEAAVR
jgi:hypothetical protein